MYVPVLKTQPNPTHHNIIINNKKLNWRIPPSSPSIRSDPLCAFFLAIAMNIPIETVSIITRSHTNLSFETTTHALT